MKLTQVMFERVGRRKGYRLVRWKRDSEFHLVEAAGESVRALCGYHFGPNPERYVPEHHRSPQVCGFCWNVFTGEVQEVRRLL
ncbi:MAG TPA: Mpv17/PMP22 family protein [Dehalococcoidia bacterium]|jgi:hypothetical protein|nr:Mpv17/PMP22 family protein [Dehalococcoidia bacterium]